MRFMPCHDCCEEDECCTGTLPDSFTLFIEGIPSGTCTHSGTDYQCSQLNAEFVLTQVGSTCLWTVLVPTDEDAGKNWLVSVTFYNSGGMVYLQVEIGLNVIGGPTMIRARILYAGVCCNLLVEAVNLSDDQYTFPTTPCCTVTSSSIAYVSANCCCTDASPAELAVTISGVNSGTTDITLDAGTCTIECDQLNDTYTFANTAPCQWSVDKVWDVTCGGTPTTDTFHLSLYTQTISGTKYLYFLIYTGANYVQYLARTSITDDCCDFATNIIELSSYLSSSFCTAKLVAASELEITASTCV